MAKKKIKKTKKKIKKIDFKKGRKYFLAVLLILILVTFFAIVNRLVKNSARSFDCIKIGTEMKCSWTNCVGQDNVLVLNHETGENRFKIIEKESGSVTFSGLSGKYIPVLICGEKIDMLPSVVF